MKKKKINFGMYFKGYLMMATLIVIMLIGYIIASTLFDNEYWIYFIGTCFGMLNIFLLNYGIKKIEKG